LHIADKLRAAATDLSGVLPRLAAMQTAKINLPGREPHAAAKGTYPAPANHVALRPAITRHRFGQELNNSF
jgi:hypothetical protein